MTYDPQKTYQYLIHKLNEKGIKYEVHMLPSKIIMVDIWYNNNFYVVQIEPEFVGFSQINDENPGFDTIPDIKFFSGEEFMAKFHSVLN